VTTQSIRAQPGGGRSANHPAGAGPRPARRGWAPDLIGAVAALSVVLVVALWVHGQGLANLRGGGTAFTSLGRLTGLVAADLMLIQVLLMARVPVIERAYGQDRLARWHRWVGFTSFDLMLAHIPLVTVGYALTDRTGLVRETWNLVTTYPGMLLAVAAATALVLAVLTSLRAARRRLRYESWHLLHLYAYLGVGLALPHQLWTGTDFLTSRLATGYWWSLWVLAAAALLGYRVALPLYRSSRHRLRVQAVVRESPGVVSVWLTGRRLDELPVRAGQFFNWRFLSGPGWTRAHPYSLSAAPGQTRLRITVKDLGDGSRALAHVRPGTRVAIEGPFGRLHDGVRTRRKVTLMASGIGVTPLRALLEEMPQSPGDVTLVYRAASVEDLVFRDEIDALAKSHGARTFYVLGHRITERASWLPQNAAHLSDVDALRQLVPDIADQDVYLCGAEPWMDAARRAALDAGVPRQRIHEERFSW